MLEFQNNGLLSPGDHPISIKDLREFLFIGPKNAHAWDSKWRLKLFTEFEKSYKQLLSVGINQIYIDGSFATDKARPNDLDAYFIVPRSLWRNSAENQLRELDPDFWNFDLINDGTGKVAYPMAINHNIELFPVYLEHTPEYADCDELIDPKIYFFRTDKHSHQEKGIIKIIVED